MNPLNRSYRQYSKSRAPLPDGPVLEEPTTCTGSLCKLCHGDFEMEFYKRSRDAPSYARPTIATIRRTIAIRLSSPRKPAAMQLPSKRAPTFEDLPTEIRLQIYRACLQPPNYPQINFLIRAWIKGGGLHADKSSYSNSRYSPLMNVYASHSFPRAVLMLNKRINAEATREIYQNITFHVAGMIPAHHLPQLKYWLTTHPMRFTTTLQLPMSILFGGTRRSDLMRFLRSKTLVLEYMKQLATMISKMPHLKNLHIILTLLLSRDQSPNEALVYCADEKLWQKRLIALRTSLPPSCEMQMVVRVDDLFQRPVDPRPVEPGLHKLASAFEKYDIAWSFTTANDGLHGISKSAWFIQIMKE